MKNTERFSAAYIMEFLPSVDPVDGLDEDVLFQVLSYLSRHDLYQWSLVSRNFASIARPLLWRRIEFRYRYMTKSEMMKKGPAKYGYSEDLLMQQIRDDDARGVWNDSRSKWNGTLEQKRFFKLHRSVTQSPEIGAMVQEYILLFRYTSPGVDPLTSDILLFLPNLRFLTVQTSVISYQTVPERKLVLDPSMLGGLSELSLDVSSITFAMVAGYMCLPNIRSLSIRGRFHKSYMGAQGIPENYKSKSSGLRSLKFEWVLDGYKQKPDPNYARLLELPHSLETLSIKLCKPAPSANLRSAWSTMDIYPGNISALLEPVKSSLKELEVIALGGTTFRHDGTRMDISTFGLLRKVTISSILTVRPSVTDPGCAGLYQLLPVSIQELKVKIILVKISVLVLLITF
jgi:hypothetical protein